MTTKSTIKTLKYFLLAMFAAFVITACQPQTGVEGQEEAPTEANPPAAGFDLQGSDPKAIAIADEVMEAMGGRTSWDSTRFISWNFFGFRDLVWDKLENRVRVDVPRDSLTILLDMKSMTGKVKKGREEFTQPDSLKKYLEQGERIWINDAYWLVMPFKLKDSGVTLSYIGEDTTMAGATAHKLGLTFKEVGVTPQNRYEVWVDKNSRLVSQWAFFTNASDDSARFTMPWQDYQQHGAIMLSGDRGQRKLSDIKVYDDLPGAMFESFEKPQL